VTTPKSYTAVVIYSHCAFLVPQIWRNTKTLPSQYRCQVSPPTTHSFRLLWQRMYREYRFEGRCSTSHHVARVWKLQILTINLGDCREPEPRQGKKWPNSKWNINDRSPSYVSNHRSIQSSSIASSKTLYLEPTASVRTLSTQEELCSSCQVWTENFI
jgi:hypothetical protein